MSHFKFQSMNPIEMALHTWRQQKVNYEASVKKVIAQLSKPIKFVPSTMFDSKLQELKEYLHYNYTYEEDQAFNEIFVHHIANVINLTLMELASKLASMLGGDVKYWQNKILDIAGNVVYHSELTIWEISKPFEKYTGLAPQYLNNLRKKRSLAKQYLNCLGAICKLIDKSKPFHEDLLKIDDSFKKLKKAEEKYYAFIEQTQDVVTSKQTNISLKGKTQAKNNLFLFLKPKDDKINTLANYKFVFNKQTDSKSQSKLLKGAEYQDLDNIFSNLYLTTKSQRQSAYSQTSESIFPRSPKQIKQYEMEDVRNQFASFMNKDKLDIESSSIDGQNTFIWNKEYFFTFWGFPIKYTQKMDYTQPFQIYDSINYQVNSEDQYDELNAEDLNSDNELSSQQSLSNQNSFVIEDSEDEQVDPMYKYMPNIGYERWSKEKDDLGQYEIILPFSPSLMPYVYEQNILNESFSKKLEGKGKQQIISVIQSQKHVSKSKIEELLKNDFQKVRKNNKVVYFRKNMLHPYVIQEGGEKDEAYSDQQQTTLEVLQNSITSPSHSMTLRSKSRPKDKDSKSGSSQRQNGSSHIRQNSLKPSTIPQEQSLSQNN